MALVGADGDARLPDGVEPPAGGVGRRRGCDVVLALGGDGTMLGALRMAAPHGVPVLGVNLGTLGYLTEVDAAHLGGASRRWREGDVHGRGAHRARARRARRSAGADRLQRRRPDRVPGRGQAALRLRIDGELLVRYASDGVIAATPQGSTAYAFAAGGPLVSPRAQGMIVMPDAPHGLFNRAVVLAEGERLGIEVLPHERARCRSSATVGCSVTPRPARRSRSSPSRTPRSVVRVHPGGFAERARRKLGITDPAGLADFDLAGHER